jgi:hypothetical protein
MSTYQQETDYLQVPHMQQRRLVPGQLRGQVFSALLIHLGGLLEQDRRFHLEQSELQVLRGLKESHTSNNDKIVFRLNSPAL